MSAADGLLSRERSHPLRVAHPTARVVLVVRHDANRIFSSLITHENARIAPLRLANGLIDMLQRQTTTLPYATNDPCNMLVRHCRVGMARCLPTSAAGGKVDGAPGENEGNHLTAARCARTCLLACWPGCICRKKRSGDCGHQADHSQTRPCLEDRFRSRAPHRAAPADSYISRL